MPPPHSKVAVAVFLLTFSFSTMYSQNGSKWATGGNSVGSGDFIGTTNNFPVTFKVNNATKMLLNTNGSFQLNNFGGTGMGIVQYDNNGVFTQLPYSNSSYVLFGNGTFGPISFPNSGWTASGSNLFYNGSGNIGIGTNNPLFKVDVLGNLRVTGTVFTTGVVITDAVSADTATLGNTNVTGTITVGGDLGLGTLTPSAKLDVIGTMNVTGNSSFFDKIQTRRITPLPGDSEIHFGDSTVIIGTSAFSGNYIHWNSTGSGPNRGLAIGNLSSRAFGLNAIVLGTSSNASGTGSVTIGTTSQSGGVNSISIGNHVSAGGPNSMTIGSGTANVLLHNTIPNSLMLGFNSNVPTLFVSSSNGIGSTGQVGIGTSSPQGKLDIRTINDPEKALLIGVPGTDNFVVYGDGYVVARDVKVTLNALTHPDYIFDPGYKLISIDSLSKFITVSHHLPGFPSAKEVAENNGISFANTQAIIFEKIEEHSLYFIQQEKKIAALEKELADLKSLISKIQLQH